jgi:hypothetical protein
VLARVLAQNAPLAPPVPAEPAPAPSPPVLAGPWNAELAAAVLADVRQRIDEALRLRAYTAPQRNVLIVFRTVEERHRAVHDPLLFTAVEDLEKLLDRWRRETDAKRARLGS